MTEQSWEHGAFADLMAMHPRMSAELINDDLQELWAEKVKRAAVWNERLAANLDNPDDLIVVGEEAMYDLNGDWAYYGDAMLVVGEWHHPKLRLKYSKDKGTRLRELFEDSEPVMDVAVSRGFILAPDLTGDPRIYAEFAARSVAVNGLGFEGSFDVLPIAEPHKIQLQYLYSPETDTGGVTRGLQHAAGEYAKHVTTLYRDPSGPFFSMRASRQRAAIERLVDEANELSTAWGMQANIDLAFSYCFEPGLEGYDEWGTDDGTELKISGTFLGFDVLKHKDLGSTAIRHPGELQLLKEGLCYAVEIGSDRLDDEPVVVYVPVAQSKLGFDAEQA